MRKFVSILLAACILSSALVVMDVSASDIPNILIKYKDIDEELLTKYGDITVVDILKLQHYKLK